MNCNTSDIEALFQGLNNKTEDQLIRDESYVLQANYLSEIERLYRDGGLNRKELAHKIDLSPSYLSQVFSGDKPLNFLTLAKIKRALNLRFEIKASFASEKKSIYGNENYTVKRMNSPHKLHLIKGEMLNQTSISLIA